MDNILCDLKKTLDENFNVSIENHNSSINGLQNLVAIIAEIEKIINNENKIILKEVVHDLESSLYSAVNALYRNAFISLRSGLELSLSYIYFVDHNYDYLFWQKNEFSLSWATIKDESKGVLRQHYLSLFGEDNYLPLINNCVELYHECSESVHGKYLYMFVTQSTNLKYSIDVMNNYIEKARNVIRLIISILIIRHTDVYSKINESYLSEVDDILKEQKLHRLLKKLKEKK